MFVPHILIVSMVGTAWIVGMMLGHISNPLLHIGTAIIVLSSLGVMLTGRLKFPDPYDPNLEEKELGEWHAHASL